MPPPDDMKLPPIPDDDIASSDGALPLPPIPDSEPSPAQSFDGFADAPQRELNDPGLPDSSPQRKSNDSELPNSSTERPADAIPVDLPATPEIAAAFDGAGFEKAEQAQPDIGALVDKLAKVAEAVSERMTAEPQQPGSMPDADSPQGDDGQQGQFREFIDLLRVLVDRIAPQGEQTPVADTPSPTADRGELPDPVAAQEPVQVQQDDAPQQTGAGMADIVRLMERQNELMDEFKNAFLAFASELVG